MAKKVFVSYSHKPGEWVLDRLVPCLLAGGAEVLIDQERMRVGERVVGAMDRLQDSAGATLLVLSPDYLSSGYCRHEMERAVERSAFVPVLRDACSLPNSISARLYADLRADRDAGAWAKLLDACEASLGCDAPHWLEVRDEVARLLDRGQSVNLVVSGHKPRWRELIDAVSRKLDGRLSAVDLDHGATVGRQGLVQRIINSLGGTETVPAPPRDLGALSRFLEARRRSSLALVHFDWAKHRDYNIDFFATMRGHVNRNELVLLIESRAPFTNLIPGDHPLSQLNPQMVELRGHQAEARER